LVLLITEDSLCSVSTTQFSGHRRTLYMSVKAAILWQQLYCFGAWPLELL